MGAKRTLSGHLHLPVEGCLDPHPLVHRPIVAERGDRLLSHQIDRVGDPVGIRPFTDGKGGVDGCLVFLACDQVHLPHPGQHEITNLLGSLRVVPGGEGVRTLEQSRQHRTFTRGEFLGGFPEIPARRRLHPVETAAEVDTVQVEFHDLLLGEMILDALGHEHLEEFAAVTPFLQFEGVAGQLLGHRARALLHPALPVVADGGAQDAEIVDPVMIEEPVVLLRHHSIHHGLGNLVVGDGNPVLDEDLADLLTRAVVDDAGRFHFRQLFQIERVGLGGELADQPGVEKKPCKRPGTHQNHGRKEPEP